MTPLRLPVFQQACAVLAQNHLGAHPYAHHLDNYDSLVYLHPLRIVDTKESPQNL